MISHSELIEWYWEFGIKRGGRYRLDPEDWLDRLYSCRSLEESLRLGRAQPRPAMALWGPRQTGKSTLISRYVENDDDPAGRDSALSWPGGTPVRFVKGAGDPVPGTVVLNPFNYESDGSGCLSRFRLTSQVADATHPIEVKLTSSTQLLHALAMGYVGECRTDVLGGQTVHLRLEDIQDRIDKLGASTSNTAPPRRDAFEALHRLADLLDELALTGLPRYKNLGPRKADVRRKLLQAAGRIADPAVVATLAFDLLWDGQPALNGFYARLDSWRSRWAREWGERPIFCSPEVAAALLDFESINRLDGKAGQALHSLVGSIKASTEVDCIRIGTEIGSPLFTGATDFAFFQALVLELIIPIRRDAPVRHKALIGFLEESDLLDFPGVSPRGANTQTLVNLNDPAVETGRELFTSVLMRGKTASIVASYAHRLTIDGFSILTRLGRAPDKPEQLANGIQTWWRAYDSKAELGRRVKSAPHLNLVLTFGAKLIQMADANGVTDKIGKVIDQLRELGDLADPMVLTHTLATNYPQFPDGRLPEDRARVSRLAGQIAEVPEFRKQFATEVGRDSFRCMVEDGGTDLLLKTLTDQARESPRHRMLDTLAAENLTAVENLLAQALPGAEDPGPRRRKLLEAWVLKLEAEMAASDEADPAGDCSARIRMMLDVDPEIFDPIPTNLRQLPRRATKIRQYVEAQLQHWWQHAEALAKGEWKALGFRDPRDVREVLLGLVDHIDAGEIADWLRDTFGQVSAPQDAKHHRRYLAVKIANALMPLSQSRPHRDASQVAERLGFFEDGERSDVSQSYRTSPHFQHFLEPYLKHLRSLADTPRQGERPPQPGDHELVELAGRIQGVPGRTDR